MISYLFTDIYINKYYVICSTLKQYLYGNDTIVIRYAGALPVSL